MTWSGVKRGISLFQHKLLESVIIWMRPSAARFPKKADYWATDPGRLARTRRWSHFWAFCSEEAEQEWREAGGCRLEVATCDCDVASVVNGKRQSSGYLKRSSSFFFGKRFFFLFSCNSFPRSTWLRLEWTMCSFGNYFCSKLHWIGNRLQL